MWRQKDGSDYNPVEKGMPVKEESVTLIEAGEFTGDSALIATDEAALFRSVWCLRSVGTTVVDPDWISFAMPVSWSGDLTFNGEAASATRVVMPTDELYVQGGRRTIVGVILDRGRFIKTVAALQGVGAEDVRLAENAFELDPEAAKRLHKSFLGMFDADAEMLSFNNHLFEWMTDAFLSARPEKDPGSGHLRLYSRIVRKAEERFEAALDGPVSLADLCLAAGASKTSLYNAFHAVCGLPPLAYFHRRKLMRARSKLLAAPAEPGAIKHIALSLGLTELGRFAVEYRQLFGESPSATLNRVP